MKHFLLAVLCSAAFTAAAFADDQCPPLKMVANLDLVSSGDGQREYVPVEIAGVPKLMILDLGAEISILTAKATEELKLPTGQANVELYSLSGAKTDRYTAVDIKLGRMKGKLKLMVAPFLDGMSDDPALVGMIGPDVLSQFDISIDFGAHKLDLLDSNHCPGKVVYWPTTALAVVPFKTLRLNQIVLDVTLDGRPFKAILDTGAWQSTLRLNVAERQFDIQPGAADTPEAGTLNERADLKTYHHVFKTLDFNGVAVGNPHFELIPDMLTKNLAPTTMAGTRIAEKDDALEAPILLGMNVLKHLHIYIAYKEQKLYITPAGAPTAASASK